MTRTPLLLALGAATALIPAAVLAGDIALTPVPAAMPKVTGAPAPTNLSPQLIAIVVAQGAMPLENPTPLLAAYGYAADGPMLPAANAVQGKDALIEASKTEPDKNTYLVLDAGKGPDAGYDYGRHFLFQGHEGGAKTAEGKDQGYLTRVNLDAADVAHRVTLMADKTVDGAPIPYVDGTAWDPFAQRLLLTSEEGPEGGVWQATADFPSKVEALTGIIGQASYEGVQVDPTGAIWLVEDEGGPTSKTLKSAKQPNSFLFRFIPKDPADLAKGGRLEALQILDGAGKAVTFHADNIDGDIMSQGMADLHRYGSTLKTRWVPVHDTDKDGTAPYDANALAKTASATPMKRPENGQFRPGSGFRDFVFTETGDTNADTAAGAEHGGFGAVLMLSQAAPDAATGEIRMVLRGEPAATGFDNIAFASDTVAMVVEDAGDKLHSQRGALDSGFLVDVTADYSAGLKPVRFLAEGRDAAATVDSGLLALGETAFQNDGDNELTGIHVSDGDASVAGLIGTKVPHAFADGWRVFYTQQHGDNVTWEVIARPVPTPAG
ncbi:MAG: DUF839 domain-containing protein [Amaricoccus sp.]